MGDLMSLTALKVWIVLLILIYYGPKLVRDMSARRKRKAQEEKERIEAEMKRYREETNRLLDKGIRAVKKRRLI